MKDASAGKKLRRWIFCAILACVLGVCVWLFWHDAADRVHLLIENDRVSPDRPVVVCKLVNRSARPVYYGVEFSVERWDEETDAWVRYAENAGPYYFSLMLYDIKPFSKEAFEYPVRIYADPFAPGKYRVVQHVRFAVSDREPNIPLTCEFTVEDS